MAEMNWNLEFPTYSFDEKGRDIVLQEYSAATRAVELEERTFGNATNIAAILGAVLAWIAVGKLEEVATNAQGVIPTNSLLVIAAVVTYLFAGIVLASFADRRRAIVYAERKVVVLRRMLGIRYGRINLVLPRERLEGEEQPFRLRFFPGWNSSILFPSCLVAGLASGIHFFIFALIAKGERNLLLGWLNPTATILALAVISFLSLLIIFRILLAEDNESWLHLTARSAASYLNVKVVDNFEQVLYGARLAMVEIRRIGIETSKLRDFVVLMEDQQFFRHCGVSWQGLGRAALHAFRLGRRSGGSTITQQLGRSLFISEHRNHGRRKIVEVLLALGINAKISKADQLDIYIASVRYAHNVIGLAKAQEYFFGRHVPDMSPAQCFFLVERVSNIGNRVLLAKIAYTVRRAVAAGLLTRDNVQELSEIYGRLIGEKKLNGDPVAISASFSEAVELSARMLPPWRYAIVVALSRLRSVRGRFTRGGARIDE